jgi:hypothetical protein
MTGSKMRLLLLLVLLGLMWNCHAQGDEPALPGSTVSAANAVGGADAFFVGSIISVTPSDSAPGGEYKSIVKITQGIWGRMSIMNAGNNVSFTLREGETLPQVGQSYVFCVAGTPEQGIFKYVAIKIFFATDANIGGIKNLAHDKPRIWR